LVLGLPLSRDFKGGSLVMVQGLQNVPDPSGVKSAVESSLGKNVDVLPVENGFHIETDALSESEETNVKGALFNQFGIPASSVTIESIGPAISSLQIEQMLYSIVIAFVVIGVITFIIFRRRVVPMAVLLVIGLDILCVLGCMSLFRVPMSLASVVAIVVLVGYAVDTNILLAYHVLKGVGGEPREQATASMNTGLMMGVLLIVVFLSLNVLTSVTQLNVLTATMIFGIAINIFNTWFLGAGILLRQAERQRGKEYHVSL
jgi:preprotein translocase subunit SecF